MACGPTSSRSIHTTFSSTPIGPESEAQLLKWLTDRFMLIQTNVAGEGNVFEKFHKAKVVLMLEEHNAPATITNVELLHKFWKKKDTLLMEGSPYASLDTKVLENTIDWNLPMSKCTQSICERQADLIELSRNLITFMYHAGKIPPGLEEEFSQMCKTLELENVSISDLKEEEQKSTIRNMLETVHRLLCEIEKTLTDDIHNNFAEKQKSIVEKIKSNLKPDNRVWVVAGEAHGRYGSPQSASGVKYLYDELENSDISYITLKYRAFVGEKPSDSEIDGLLNDPSLIEKDLFNEIQSGLDAIKKYRANLQTYYDKVGHTKQACYDYIAQEGESIESYGEHAGYDTCYYQNANVFARFALEAMLSASE